MEHQLAMAPAIAVAVVATLAVFTPERARADDITIDSSPFVSSTTRDAVRGELKAHPEVVRQMASEWELQGNLVPRVQSPYTSSQARADYIKERSDVNALYGEDSGSNSPWVLKGPSDTSMMGGPKQ